MKTIKVFVCPVRNRRVKFIMGDKIYERSTTSQKAGPTLYSKLDKYLRAKHVGKGTVNFEFIQL